MGSVFLAIAIVVCARWFFRSDMSTAVAEALAHLKGKGLFHFVHQAGPQDTEMVRDAYARHGIAGLVKPFFTDMARQYREADLIVCRAGATTIAEVTAMGKGVIFIPFPFAADNHQALNAGMLTDKGASETILQQDLTGALLAERIAYYAANPDALYQMAVKARMLGKPDAARLIVSSCYRLCG